MRRQACVILTVAAAAAIVGTACSEGSRHQVLSFFFDGVPPLGGPTADSSSQDIPPDQRGIGSRTGPEPARVIAHTPYRENQCGRCHNKQTGYLFRSIKEGLCTTCHAALINERTYVHGPVAVNECLFCHHYHGSPLPNLLLQEVNDLCLRCHDRGEIEKGAYHSTIEVDSCDQCHDAHGGADPFFLKREGN